METIVALQSKQYVRALNTMTYTTFYLTNSTIQVLAQTVSNIKLGFCHYLAPSICNPATVSIFGNIRYGLQCKTMGIPKEMLAYYLQGASGG